MPEDELESWRSEWQALGGKSELAESLVGRARADASRMRRAAAMEVLAAAASTTVSVWMVVRSHGSLELVALAAIILLFNGAWLTHFFTTRANLFRSSGEGIDAFVDLARRRLDAERRWVRHARRWVFVVTAAIAPWLVWVFVAHFEGYRAEPWRAVVGFGGAALIIAGLLLFSYRKEKRICAEEADFERQLARVDIG